MSDTKLDGAKSPTQKNLINPLTRRISSLRLITVHFWDVGKERQTYFILAKDMKAFVCFLVSVKEYPWDRCGKGIERITSTRPQIQHGTGGPVIRFDADDLFHADETVVWESEIPDDFDFEDDDPDVG